MPPTSLTSVSDDFENSTFSYQYDAGKKEVKVFCVTCIKYGNTKKGRTRDNDFSWMNGIIFNSKRRENQDKVRHLTSSSHKEAVSFLEQGDDEQIRKGLPTISEQRNCTENAMVAAMFMATHNLSNRIYPHLCAFLSVITPSDMTHPLGNRHQAHNSAKEIFEANLETVENSLWNFPQKLQRLNVFPRLLSVLIKALRRRM